MMKKEFENIKKKIMLRATEACAYRENTRVISEAEIKEILEEAEKDVPDINVGNNGWIPVKERLPEHTDNVLVTDVKSGIPEVALGWYNHCYDRWRVCYKGDQEFYYSDCVAAWKEITDEPYQPKGGVPD